MIDRRFQGKGYGAAVLGLILDELRDEGHCDRMEACVKKGMLGQSACMGKAASLIRAISVGMRRIR